MFKGSLVDDSTIIMRVALFLALLLIFRISVVCTGGVGG